jgi:hypothetical protein
VKDLSNVLFKKLVFLLLDTVPAVKVVHKRVEALDYDTNRPRGEERAQRSQDEPVGLLGQLVPFTLREAFINCCAFAQSY